MNVVFLDIDGVLNSGRSFMARVGPQKSDHADAAYRNLVEEYANPAGLLPYIIQNSIDTVDPVAVGMVNRLIRKSHAWIVLSSSHRMEFRELGYRGSRHLEALSFYLGALGIVGRLLDITPTLYLQRGVEVATWFEERKVYEVKRNVILDDGQDFIPGQNLVLVKDGFSSADYFAATKYLGVEETLLT